MRSAFQCNVCDKIMMISQKNVAKAKPGDIDPQSAIKGRQIDEYKCKCGFTKYMLSGWRVHHRRYE